jgi:threonyl-tRNA synthetase
MHPAMFENADALKKLAELNPTPEGSASGSSSAHAGRKGGARTIASSSGKISGAERIGGSFTVEQDPAWIKERDALLEAAVKRGAEQLAALDKPPITVVLPDGKKVDGVAWKTSPLDVATSISKGLAQATCVASVKYSNRLKGADSTLTEVETNPDGDDNADASAEWELWDVARPLEGDCELQLHKFDDPRGKEVFWHSSAHILGEALESLYGARLTHGPPTDTGFFYDSYMGQTSLSAEMTEKLEKKAKAIADQKQPYERVVVTKEECLQLFGSNPFKVAMISSKLPEGSSTTVYRCGPFVDLCKGPHLPNTGKVKAFAVTKSSSALWLGKVGNDDLQRVYAVSFPDKKELAEWKKLQEEAAKRDHRLIGIQQDLFFFEELSPGSCFFLPHGCRIYNKLVDIIREQYFTRGYTEVVTPNMYNLKLWETSGHAAKYKENMFCFDIEGQEFGLKPMNCPGHCIMFKHRKRSYRELPMRFADFGVLHRNELSGALTGLTRVRRFQQDDAHIFCTVAQIKEEVAGVLDMIATVYKFFGMTFALKLSTRPETYLGEVAVWDKAEAALTEALEDFKAKTGQSWSLNPGDGAFYGPKIDVQVFDALKRAFQCATVQLDFVQPQRFDLKYQAAGGEGVEGEAQFERPVMVHRAVLGSVERMIAILTEHYAGKWPFFLSPRQAMVVPVSPAFEDYAKKVHEQLRAAGFHADVELSRRTLNKMVRESQLSQYNFILVVGGNEEKDGTVNVRTRDNAVHGVKPVAEVIADFKRMTDEYTLDVDLDIAKASKAS